MILAGLAKFVSTVLSLYMIICTIRVFLSWIPSLGSTRIGQIIARITDPYLNLFRDIPLFHTPAVDFSPIIALAVLSVLNNLF